ALLAAVLVQAGLCAAAPGSAAAPRGSDDCAPLRLPLEPLGLLVGADAIQPASIGAGGAPDRPAAHTPGSPPADARSAPANAPPQGRPLAVTTLPVYLTTQRLRL